MCAGAHASLSRPLSAAIDLHEIHLARQSSLQVPVGHITVPGGIKLCSPGTFLVANYLIINNGSCQVNFMKPKRLLSDTPTRSGSPMMLPRHLWAKWLCLTPAGASARDRFDTGSRHSCHAKMPQEVPVGKGAVPKSCGSSGKRLV